LVIRHWTFNRVLRDIITITLNPTIDRVMEVPGFRIGGHLPGRMRSRTPSGKAFNVSRALGLLGVTSTAAGWMGRDAIDSFEAAARAAGALPRFIPIDAPTRENITVLDTKRGVETHIRDAGPTITEADIEKLEHELAILSHPNAVVVFSGSTPPGVSAERFGKFVDQCIAKGARVAIDTSREPLAVAAQRAVWMIKPNLAELSELSGRELAGGQDVVAAARELNTRIPVVVVTLGEEGACCLADGQALHGKALLPHDQVRSTVGCGDAFMAGFLAEICATHGTPESAFRQALAVAAASAMNDQPAIFTPENVAWARERLEIQRL
jgi:1-phosphofructokinase family hexose kinase